MRIQNPYSFPQGYEPGFVPLNQEQRLLDITHPSICTLLEESKIVPETLILRCALHPIPIANKLPKVRLIAENEPLEETFLYEEETVLPGYNREVKSSQWQGIALEYVGIGQGTHQNQTFTFSGKTLPSGQIESANPLYLKPFAIENQSFQMRTITVGHGHILSSPPGVIDTKILRGYGGYYQPGTLLADVEQVYYALTSNYDKTRIRLYSSALLQAQHTPAPRGGREFNQDVMFSPAPREEEYLSLKGAIAAGYARLSVKMDWGQIPYSSYLCEPVPGHPNLVTVSFRP
jgi:hypothetical protein